MTTTTYSHDDAKFASGTWGVCIRTTAGVHKARVGRHFDGCPNPGDLEFVPDPASAGAVEAPNPYDPDASMDAYLAHEGDPQGRADDARAYGALTDILRIVMMHADWPNPAQVVDLARTVDKWATDHPVGSIISGSKIPDNVIHAVRTVASLVSVVGATVQLHPAGGSNLKAACPFHDEVAPSFHVSTARSLWHCFGCGEGGDVIAFVQKRDSLSFAKAVRKLADEYSVTDEVARALDQRPVGSDDPWTVTEPPF